MSTKSSTAGPYISALQQHPLVLSYLIQDDGQEISQRLNEKRLRMSDLGFTYRQINSWDEHGLLDTDREGTEWRTFSYMDHVWLCLIREMRKYGISLKQIAKIKKFLTEALFSVNNRSSVLEFYTANLGTRKQACVLIIFDDASALICPYSQWLSQQVLDKVPNHVMIHLNPIWQVLFPKSKMLPEYKNNLGWSLEDFNLLQAMNSDSFVKVEVTYQGGKPETVKGLKRVNIKTQIVDLLQENKYQKLEIEQAGGGITRILQWKRIKLDKA